MTEASSEACCHAFLHGWVQRYGLPASACSDNGNSFVARLWRDLQSTLNIKVLFIPFYHQATNGIVERCHGTIKSGLKAMLLEMGDTYKQDWFLHLPWVLLSRRVALMPDVGTSSSKLVLGLDPVVPGQLVGDPNPLPSAKDLRGLVSHLEANADVPGVPTSNHNKPNKTYMPTTTETATHVYIKKENPTGLLQTYTGPHKIVDRPSDSTIKVKVGTFKSGVENIQLHHWQNAKPAMLREDFTEAQMVPRGRPSKKTSSPSEGQKPTEASPQPSPPAEDIPSTGLASSGRVLVNNKQKVNKQPTRRSERLLNKNHETSSIECRQPASSVPPGRENSNAPNRSSLFWSPNAAELAELNKSINKSRVGA